ncbi:hypothetical protein NUSPORA_01863 [Nucleospora cyclopteri]
MFYDKFLYYKCNKSDCVLQYFKVCNKDLAIFRYFEHNFFLNLQLFNFNIIDFKIRIILISKITFIYFLRIKNLKTFWEQDILEFLNKQNETINKILNAGYKKDNEILIKRKLLNIILEKYKKTMCLIEKHKTTNKRKEKKEYIKVLIQEEILAEADLCGIDKNRFLEDIFSDV